VPFAHRHAEELRRPGGGGAKLGKAAVISATVVLSEESIRGGIAHAWNGLNELAAGNINKGLYDTLHGTFAIIGGVRGVRHLLSFHRTARHAEVEPPQAKSGCPDSQCFVAGTPVVVEVLDKIDVVAAEIICDVARASKELPVDEELVFEKALLTPSAASLLTTAVEQDDESLIAVMETWRRMSGAALFAIGISGGVWYAWQLRRRKKYFDLCDEPVEDPEDLSDEAFRDGWLPRKELALCK
jgi:hypothetical protein